MILNSIEHYAYYSQEAITNVVKYSGATTLTISTYEEEKHFVVEVTDNGCWYT